MRDIPKASIAHTKREHFWITNVTFAKTNKSFKKACQLAGLPLTKRQASKFRMKKGLAYKSIVH